VCEKILVGNPQSVTPLRKLMRIWEDNIKIDLIKMGCEWVD